MTNYLAIAEEVERAIGAQKASKGISKSPDPRPDRPFLTLSDAFCAPYSIVEDLSQLAAVLPVLAGQVVGLDTETTGLDPQASRIRLVQLATKERVFVVDCFRLPVEALAPIFAEVRFLIGHNLKFDLQMLAAAGLEFPALLGYRISDTMLASQLLSAGDRSVHHSLAELAQRVLKHPLPKEEQTGDWSGHLTEGQLRYAAQDVAILLPLKDRLHHDLDAAGLIPTALLENAALPAVAWMELCGMPIDQQRWLQLAEQAEHELTEIEAQLNAVGSTVRTPLGLEVAQETRWSSPAQVLKLLQERGLDLEDTSEETFILNQDRDPLILPLLRYRDAFKRAGMYGRDFLKHVHPLTGRIHADYFQMGSDAGRMSCRTPNLQQVPRLDAYRACFHAPEGRSLVKADYAQIELRVAAEMARDPRMVNTFRDGIDIHAATARSVMGRDEVTKADRQAAKAVNFGLIYGMGAAKLRVYAKTIYGVDLDQDRANAYRESFFETYPGLRGWHKKHGNGGVMATRTVGGRRRQNVQKFTWKVNTPVQGTAADGLKAALGLLYERRNEVPGAELVAAVHDEIVVECAEDQAEKAKAWLVEAMIEGMREYLREVPVEVESQVGRDWSMALEAATEKMAS